MNFDLCKVSPFIVHSSSLVMVPFMVMLPKDHQSGGNIRSCTYTRTNRLTRNIYAAALLLTGLPAVETAEGGEPPAGQSISAACWFSPMGQPVQPVCAPCS